MNDTKSLRTRMLNKYGLTPAQLDQLWAMQGGKCGGCGKPLARSQARLDHDPKTFKARAYVCDACILLSRAADDPERFEEIITRLHDQPVAEELYATAV
jgi:hypothetical protein